MEPDERSRPGLPRPPVSIAIPGVTVANFLRNALNARRAANPEDKGIDPGFPQA